ncbi:MAG: hypothetical protein NTW67_05890 [Candidatus Woesearchaeota archaeon]|nr:hypothetical protein [Candidatus Woesearchaeota archaeon]
MYIDSITGAGAYRSYGYGYASKLYGGGMKKAMYESPSSVGGVKYGEAVRNQRLSDYIYSNKDKLDCSFNKQQADRSVDPCIFDEKLKKYCCVVGSTSLNY